jgi:hypothetical protein
MRTEGSQGPAPAAATYRATGGTRLALAIRLFMLLAATGALASACAGAPTVLTVFSGADGAAG